MIDKWVRDRNKRVYCICCILIYGGAVLALGRCGKEVHPRT